MTLKQAKTLKPGDIVFWEDPDGGSCSRNYTIKTVSVTGNIVSIEDETGDGIGCYARELSMPAEKSFELTLDVKYRPNGVGVNELKDRLEHLIRHGINEGLLTGETEAEVVNWDFKIKEFV